MRANFFYQFAFLFFLNLVIPVIGDIFGRLGFRLFLHAFKLPLFTMFCLCVFWTMIKGKLTIFFESWLFLLFFIPVTLIGFLENPISRASFLHIYLASIPIFAMSAGSYFAKTYGKHLDKMLEKFVFSAFWLFCILVPVYYCFFRMGFINRLGFSASVATISAYFLIIRRFRFFLVCIILVFLTGKRVNMVMLVAQIGILLLYTFSKPTKRNVHFSFSILVLLSVVGVMIFLYGSNIVRGFNSLKAVNLRDPSSLSIATSGRYDQALCVIKHMNENKYLWLIGGGVGETYEFSRIGNDMTEKRNYAHSGILGYTLIYGMIFSVLLYCSMFLTFFRGILTIGNTYVFMVFAMYFLSSFFGATIIVNPLFWIFFGIVKELVCESERTTVRVKTFSCLPLWPVRVLLKPYILNRTK